MSVISSPDHKENMDPTSESFVENLNMNTKQETGFVGMTEHERAALTRKILLKLDFR